MFSAKSQDRPPVGQPTSWAVGTKHMQRALGVGGSRQKTSAVDSSELPLYERLEAAREVHKGLRGTPNTRAKELFTLTLSPEQLAQFERVHWFTVVGGTTGYKYTIHTGFSLNIHLRFPSMEYSFCGGPINCPIMDRFVGQKLWLESDEEIHFLTMCNMRYGVRFAFDNTVQDVLRKSRHFAKFFNQG